jgi:hypothetical protein
MKKYRFFYHYYRQYKCMSVHYRNKCYKVDNIVCNAKSETKWNNTQPQLTIRGYATSLEIQDGTAFIN